MEGLLAVDEIVQAGCVFDLTKTMVSDSLRGSVVALFEELGARAVDAVLVGGVALMHYAAARNTQDVDLVIDPADLARMDWTVVERDDDFARVTFRGVRVDLLLTSNPVFATVHRAMRTEVEITGGLRVPCATREGLLLLKLYALPSLYRQGKLDRAALYETDVLMLHRGADVDFEPLFAELSAHLGPTEVAELRGIVEEQRGRRRFER